MRLAVLAPFGLWLALLGACGDAGRPPADHPTSSGVDLPVASAPAAPNRTPPEAAGPLVAFLGDSLSAGLHVDAHEAFPAVLQRRLAETGTPFRLVNAGVSGDTTAGGVTRVDWLLAQDPDWIVVELGANDGLRGVTLESIESNLREILKRIEAGGASAILLGMKLPPNYGEEYTLGFETLFERIAEDRGVRYVPFFLEGVGGVPDLNHPDGLHPTVEGHARVATHLEPFFRRWLFDDAPPPGS